MSPEEQAALFISESDTTAAENFPIGCTTDPTDSRLIHGIVTPMVTPLVNRTTLDLPGLERLTQHLINGGVSALFLLGTTGEFAAMSHELCRELVIQTMRLVGERIPVFVGISDTCLTESLQLAECAADHGATACVVTAPYYYRPFEPLMGDYLTELANESPLPLILYNMPENTGVNFSLETVRRVIDHPRFIGMKDSGGNLTYFGRVCELARQREDFSVLMGPDALLKDAMELGAAGGVNSGSNLCPELFVEMYKTWNSGDARSVKRLQKKIELLNEIYAIPKNSLGVPCGLKAALAQLGICGNYMIPPWRPADEKEQQAIHKIVKTLSP